MKKKTKTRFAWFCSISFLVAGLACSVEKTEEGEMPDVDVDAEAGELPDYEIVKTEEGEMPDVDVDVDPGKLPEYDIDGPDVDVGTKEMVVDVPKVKVVYEEEEITVPYVDVDLPGDDDDIEREDRVVAVKMAVPNPGYDVKIREIYVVDDELWVLSELHEGQRPGGPVTISDTVVVKVRDDMDVKHFVIGEPVRTGDNDDYEFIAKKSDLASSLSSARAVYTS